MDLVYANRSANSGTAMLGETVGGTAMLGEAVLGTMVLGYGTESGREWKDIGVLKSPELDLAFGSEENDFECKIPLADACCDSGYLIYAEGTEYGGIVDNITVDTASDSVTYSGRTWHGVLGSKCILPLQSTDGSTTTVGVNIDSVNASGESLVNRYLVLSGDANRCISYLIDRVGLSDLFCVSEADAGVNVSKYQFERYTDAYTGLRKMLASCGHRLKIVQEDGKVMLSAVPKVDYSQEKEFESELIPFVAKSYLNKVNHLICLGSGELENRLVVHLYADAEGNISQTQTFFGVDEYAVVYDYPNAGSTEGEEVTEEDKRNELIASGKERFKELRQADTIDIDFDITDDAYYIGDIVGTLDSRTGISVTAEVKKKIVTLKNNHVNISYIVG